MAVAAQGGHPPVFGGGAGPNGYQGLGQIVQLLQGGINQSQMDNLNAGATGADGMSIGGMHGAFGGLSPYAVHFLATSGLLQKQTAAQTPTTGPDGQPLTGSALLMANLMNQLNGQQASTYKLADGIGADQLSQLFGVGFGGHGAYAKGFNATGATGGQPPMGGGPFHPPHGNPGQRVGMGGGMGHFPVRHPNQGHGGQLPFRTVGGGNSGPGGRHVHPGNPGAFRGRRGGPGQTPPILRFPVRQPVR